MSSLTGLGCQRPLLAFRRMTKPVPPSPWPDTGFLGRNILRRCLFSKIKKTSHVIIFKEFNNLQNLSQVFWGRWIATNNSPTFCVKVFNTQKIMQLVNKRIRDQFHNCEPNYCYIWIVRTVFFFSTNLKE